MARSSGTQYPDNWDEIRRKVYQRDNYTCQECGATNVELHAHHIVPKADGGEDRPANLITYCSKCHSQVHNRPLGSAEGNPEDYMTPAEQRWEKRRRLWRNISRPRYIDLELFIWMFIAFARYLTPMIALNAMGEGNVAGAALLLLLWLGYWYHILRKWGYLGDDDAATRSTESRAR